MGISTGQQVQSTQSARMPTLNGPLVFPILPEQILILQAGGSGLYSMVMPSRCAGTHSNAAVSVKVEADLFCEIPGRSGT